MNLCWKCQLAEIALTVFATAAIGGVVVYAATNYYVQKYLSVWAKHD